MNPLLFIPCYNHSNQINDLLEDIRNYYNNHILIIDDGSSIPVKINSHHDNITLKTNKINKGKGFCIIEASKYMLDNKYSHLLVIDADGQHSANKINEFISKDKDFDIIYGRRDFKKPMPLSRKFSNTVTSLLISFICKKRIYDTQCGFRRYKSNLFYGKSYIENGYQFESEILLKSINKKSKIDYVNIPTIYNDNISSMNYMYDSYKFIKCILKNII